MSDFTLQLGSVSFLVDGQQAGDFGQVVQALSFGATPRGDVPRLATVRSDVPRSFSFPAIVEAATKDEAIAMVSAANRALSVTNTVVVHSKDATNSVTFQTYPSGSVKQAAFDPAWETANWQRVQIAIAVGPYGYGDQVVIQDTLSAPGTIDLSDTEGEYPAPLALEFDAGAEKLHSVYVALNEHPEWDGWLTAAAGLTWTNMSASTADATAYSGFRKRTTGATRAVTAFETKDVPPGSYVVLVRAKVTGAAAATIDIAQQARWTTTIPSGATAWRYYEVGSAEIALPYSVVRGTAGATMDIGLTGTASVYVDIDEVVLLPYRAGYMSWHPPAAYDSASYWYMDVFFDSGGLVYLDDVVHLEHAVSPPIRSLTGELIVLCDEDGGDHASTSLDYTLTQTPRFSLYR